MENASKALLMAGGVLIGLLIISLGVYLFTNFGGTAGQIQANIDENQLAQFNSQFTSYVGRDNVTIHEVVSMAKLATQNNQSYQLPFQTANGNNNYITVLRNGVAIELGYNGSYTATQRANEIEQKYNQIISDEVNSISDENGLPKYTVQVEISDVTRRVYRVICNRI